MSNKSYCLIQLSLGPVMTVGGSSELVLVEEGWWVHLKGTYRVDAATAGLEAGSPGRGTGCRAGGSRTER